MRKLRFSIVITSLFLSLLPFQLKAESNLLPNQLVAIINGQKVFYKHIAFTPELIEKMYGKSFSPQELAEKIITQEKYQLIRITQNIIYKQKIEEWGITATDEEARKRLREVFKRQKIDQAVISKTKKIYLAIIKSLEEYIEHPEKDKEIHKKNLAGVVILQEWEIWKTHNTPEAIQKLKNMVPVSVEDTIEKSIESTKRDIVLEKFQNKIVGNILVSEKETKIFYRNIYENIESPPQYSKIKESLRRKLIEREKGKRIKAWWKLHGQRANIQILVDKYKDFTELSK